MNIHIKPLKINEKNLEMQETREQVKLVQTYLDTHELKLEENTLNLIIMQGIYQAKKENTKVVAVFVNTTPEVVVGLKCTLRFRVLGENIQFAKLNLKIPPVAFGELYPDEGMLIHLNVPTRGKEEDIIYKGSELQAAFTEIEYLKINKK